MKICKGVFLALVLVGSLFATTGARPQNLERGAISGTTLDTSHAAVPKAKVTLTNPSTGIRREIVDGDDGSFIFQDVLPGEYSLKAEAPNFAVTIVNQIVLNVGGSVRVDIVMPLKTQQQTITVTAENAQVESPTAGISQLINAESVSNLPLTGRDYRDLAALSPSAQVVPGLRGGVRLGGQQSDYSGFVVDGADLTNNFFGENFGSLETKNFTIPLESIQEFQVVANGFAPEFGRATGGLLNVVTKSGTNQVHGDGHYYYRGGKLTEDDYNHTPSNISDQHQFGGSVGFPIHKDRQFFYAAFDIQREHGPLTTTFCAGQDQAACIANLQAATGPVFANCTGPAAVGGNCANGQVPLPGAPSTSGLSLPKPCKPNPTAGESILKDCFGINSLFDYQGAHNQSQNLATVLGHYDYQFSPANHFSVRGIYTRNHTTGFTGGRGQGSVPIAFGNTEDFHNDGVSGVFTLTTAMGQKVNELRFVLSGETRPRHPNDTAPRVFIPGGTDFGGATFGQNFFLPINNDNGKMQAGDNFSYSFGKHDMKWGGDVDTFVDRKDMFAGWNAGEYDFGSIAAFNSGRSDFGFAQGFGIGESVFKAGTLFPVYQTGVGLYWQDKWQIKPRLTITYGLRWDGTWNPQPQQPIPGQMVTVGEGTGSHGAPVPQRTPNDFGQWGPRVGFAWNIGGTEHPTVVRAAWGLYYAQTPPIFMTDTFNLTNITTCIFSCGKPNADFPYLFPSQLPASTNLCTLGTPANDPLGLGVGVGCPSINYVDPKFKNPRVSNFTVGAEHGMGHGWTVSANYGFVHSWYLRTGGFSTNVWARNFVSAAKDGFGRAILTPAGANQCPGNFSQPAFVPLDCSLGSGSSELGSFSRGNFHEVIITANKRFSNHFQFFANYTWSTNKDNASTERDTDTFFSPQDPFNVGLDYGRNGLDVTHQFKASGVVDLPWGFTWSSNFIFHSGLAYPAYDILDANHDGVSNQGHNNDRPVVTPASGTPFLLQRYPARQPDFAQWDMRLNKTFRLGERYNLQLIADVFNITNYANKYSNPDNTATVPDQLTARPRPGQVFPNGTYQVHDQVSNGATPLAGQFGVRFQF